MAEQSEQGKKTPASESKLPVVGLGVAFVLILFLIAYIFFSGFGGVSEEPEEGEVESLTTQERLTDSDEADSEEEADEVTPVEGTWLETPDTTEDVSDEEESTEEEESEELFADLYVKDYSFSDDPKQNEEFTVYIEIGNKGDEDAHDFHWEWWASDDGKTCGDEIDELKDGHEITVECQHTYTEAEEFETKVLLDPEDNIDESDEDNNEVARDVEPEAEEKADLYISEYSFDPVPEKTVPFEVRIGIKNQGNAPAEDFWWEWWPTAYSYECREHIDVIAPNSEKVVTCDYTYGGWIGDPGYPTKAIADADDDVDELDEDNNEYTEGVVPIH